MDEGGDRSRAAKKAALHRPDIAEELHAPTHLACTLTLKVTHFYMAKGGGAKAHSWVGRGAPSAIMGLTSPPHSGKMLGDNH